MNYNISRILSLLILSILLSCAPKKKDVFLEYLGDLDVNDSEFGELQNYYMINLNACSSCVELNLDYLTSNPTPLNLDLILVGHSSQYQNQIEKLGYDVVYDKKNLAARYGLYNQKPLLVVIKNGDVCKKMNIQDSQVLNLAAHLICEKVSL